MKLTTLDDPRGVFVHSPAERLTRRIVDRRERVWPRRRLIHRKLRDKRAMWGPQCGGRRKGDR